MSNFQSANLAHDNSHQHKEGSCCSPDLVPTQVSATELSSGRSFRVNGLDCAEEVGILSKVVGAEVGVPVG